MTFIDWEIENLRIGLNLYRLSKAEGGKHPSWETVVINMMTSGVTDDEFSIDGDEPELKPEALRRFATGFSVLAPDKLRDIKAFLIKEKIISDAPTSDPEQLRDIFAAKTHLANETQEAQEFLRSFAAKYKNRENKSGDNQIPNVILNFTLDESGMFFRVEEHCEHFSEGTATFIRGEIVKTRRRGYAFATTGLNMLHILLQGPQKEDRVVYAQTHVEEVTDSVTQIDFLRMGKPIRKSQFSSLSHQKTPSPTDNIFHFLLS
ncbi:hypothetical protein ABH944_005435 [Caballeronia udeis]|uniref:Uncharacterized protein n=1 Tax=Caballeronia udeis TaxID=1232866 RepID=A0ABW8MNF6_9BURK